jgi:hypothetical protein
MHAQEVSKRVPGGLTRMRSAFNGGLKVRVMVVLPFLEGERERGGDCSLPRRSLGRRRGGRATQDRVPGRVRSSDRAVQEDGWECMPRWR